MIFSWKQWALFLMIMGYCSAGYGQTRSQVYGSDLDKQTMTFSMQGDVSMTTFESEAAESKESAQSITTTLSAYAGEARKVGIAIRSSENNVNFDLNQNNMKASWFDVYMKWRLWWFTPSITAGLTQLSVTKEDASFIDIYAKSIGAGLDFSVPLFDRAVATASYHVYQNPEVLGRENKDIELGNRGEMDLNASIDLTPRMLDLIVGYRTRNYNVKVDGETFNEKSQGAYAGLRLGLYF